jgi:hypothetical protein
VGERRATRDQFEQAAFAFQHGLYGS